MCFYKGSFLAKFAVVTFHVSDYIWYLCYYLRKSRRSVITNTSYNYSDITPNRSYRCCHVYGLQFMIPTLTLLSFSLRTIIIIQLKYDFSGITDQYFKTLANNIVAFRTISSRDKFDFVNSQKILSLNSYSAVKKVPQISNKLQPITLTFMILMFQK